MCEIINEINVKINDTFIDDEINNKLMENCVINNIHGRHYLRIKECAEI